MHTLGQGPAARTSLSFLYSTPNVLNQESVSGANSSFGAPVSKSISVWNIKISHENRILFFLNL